MTQFNFVDSPMGAGKTTALFSKLNKEYQKQDNKRYICIVLYIAEQNRFKESLKETQPKIPKDGRKIDDIVKLIGKGENIITTHSLFGDFNDSVIDSIKNSQYDYDLFIDEQPTVLHGEIGGSNNHKNTNNDKLNDINSYDLSLALSNDIIKKTDTGKYVWNNKSVYNSYGKGVFFSLKQYLSKYDLYKHSDSNANDKPNDTFISMTKIDIFTCFNQVWVLSYLIKGSLLENYFNFYNITDFNYYHVENSSFIQGYKKAYPNIDRLVLEPFKYCFNKSLSYSGYDYLKISDYEELLRKMDNFKTRKIEQNTKPKSKQGKRIPTYCYTVYQKANQKLKSAKSKIKNKIDISINKTYTLPCNIKGTNEYQDRYIVGYLVDRHVRPMYQSFFAKHGINVDIKLYSLSELIQFIWRSNIRDENSTQPVYVYIAGKYMYGLFTDFIKKCNSNNN